MAVAFWDIHVHAWEQWINVIGQIENADDWASVIL